MYSLNNKDLKAFLILCKNWLIKKNELNTRNCLVAIICVTLLVIIPFVKKPADWAMISVMFLIAWLLYYTLQAQKEANNHQNKQFQTQIIISELSSLINKFEEWRNKIEIVDFNDNSIATGEEAIFKISKKLEDGYDTHEFGFRPNGYYELNSTYNRIVVLFNNHPKMDYLKDIVLNYRLSLNITGIIILNEIYREKGINPQNTIMKFFLEHNIIDKDGYSVLINNLNTNNNNCKDRTRQQKIDMIQKSLFYLSQSL